MDPVTVVTIAALLIILAPTLGPLVGVGIGKLFVNIYDKIEESKRLRRKKNKKYKEKDEKKEAIYKSLINDQNMEFKNIKTSEIKKFNVTEIINFDKDKDQLFHGILSIKQQDGSVVEDDIYLFQPRVYAKDVLLGPHFTKKGNLSDKYAYTTSIPGTNEHYVGYVPKREFMSCRQFDYVSSSVHNNTENIKQFINIEIPRDENGNYIPVDLNDKEELESLRQYISARTDYGVDPDEYLDSRIKMAEEAYLDWQIATRPKYAEPIREVSESELKRVEKARKSREQREHEQRLWQEHLAYGHPDRDGLIGTAVGSHRMASGMMGRPMGGPGSHLEHNPMMPPPPHDIEHDTPSRGMGK